VAPAKDGADEGKPEKIHEWVSLTGSYARAAVTATARPP
jgi:hypothetical protein